MRKPRWARPSSNKRKYRTVAQLCSLQPSSCTFFSCSCCTLLRNYFTRDTEEHIFFQYWYHGLIFTFSPVNSHCICVHIPLGKWGYRLHRNQKTTFQREGLPPCLRQTLFIVFLLYMLGHGYVGIRSPFCLHFPSCHCNTRTTGAGSSLWALFVGFRDLNSSPHTCMASAFPHRAILLAAHLI